jgi:2-methylcitrate dehydratase PrpD
MEVLSENAWTKKLNPGWAAHNGVMACLMAQKGFKAPSTILEGKHGFLRMGSDDPKPEKILNNIGSSYEISRTSIKPYSCCRYIQGPIDAVLKIMRENRIQAEEVEKVTIGMLKVGIPFVVEPRELKYNPTSLIEAQFSTPFGVSMALIHGQAGLEQYVPDNWKSPAVKKMMSRIICVEDEDIEKEYPKKWATTAKIQTQDGKTHFIRVDYPKGDPENPLSWSELEDKFNDLAKEVYSQERRQQIIQRISELQAERDIAEISTLFLRDASRF